MSEGDQSKGHQTMEEELLDAPTRMPEANKENGSSAREWPEIEGIRLLRELGRGGMGIVFMAVQESLQRNVALKTIATSDHEMASYLVREARIVGQLEHPGIVPVFEVHAESEPKYFIMGLVDGEDLSRNISRRVWSPEQAVELGIKVCEALEYAHQQGVLHLDIKPANILLDSANQPKLTDFGVAAIREAQVDGAFGSAQYMSPEQVATCTAELTEASDVYSLGAVLYAAIAGRPPIVSSNPETLLLKVVSEQPRSLRSYGLPVPACLDAILLKCLEKDVRKRYSAISELKADLDAYRNGEPVTARPPTIWRTAVYQARKHVFAASVSGSAVILLLCLVAMIMYQFVSQSNELGNLRAEHEHAVQQLRFMREGVQLTEDEQHIADVFEQAAQQALMEYDTKNPTTAVVMVVADAVVAEIDARRSVKEEFRQVLIDFARAHSLSVHEDQPALLANDILHYLQYAANSGGISKKVDLPADELNAETPVSPNAQ